MKLRLETGNFSIKMTHIVVGDGQTLAPAYGSLPTGLKPIDFIGSVICYDVNDYEGFSTVINAVTNGDYPHVVDFNYIDGKQMWSYYNSLNGKVSINIDEVLDDDSTDDSGSDDGGSDDSGWDGGIK